MITDEMVELATGTMGLSPSHWSDMRAALEAVAPQLIAQGMREAKKIRTSERRGYTFKEYTELQVLQRLEALEMQVAELNRILSPKVNQAPRP